MINERSGKAVGSRGRIELLQLLRGVAALMVVMFHARIYEAQSPSNAFATWLTGSGAAGVDLFFCISGFVMVYTTQTAKARHPADFVIKRLCRVVPSYTVATILFVLAMQMVGLVFGFHDPNYRFAPEQIVKSLLFIPLMLTAKENVMWGSAALHVGWTLNYEMYFYAVFAGSLLFRRFRWIAFWVWMILTLFVLPTIFKHGMALDAYHFYDWHQPYLNLMTSPLIWEFAAGVVIGHLYLRNWRFPNAETAWLATILAVTYVGWILLNRVNPGFGPARWGYCFIGLLAVLMFADNTLRFRVPRSLVWLGNISFSLYLVHPLIIEGLGISMLQFDALRPYMVGVPFVAFMSALSICAAYPLHVFVERGLSDALRRRILRRLPVYAESAAKVAS